jgi:hypothetical protein
MIATIIITSPISALLCSAHTHSQTLKLSALLATKIEPHRQYAPVSRYYR